MDTAVIVSCVLAVVLYLNTLYADFAYDDSRAIQKNPDLLPTTPLANIFFDDFWGTPLTHSGSHKSYRPICVLTYRLNYFLGGLTPWGFHLGNVICHALTTAVFTLFARTVFGGGGGSGRQAKDLATLSAGALFASHPIHTEAVAGVVGRADVLGCCFFVLTVLSYVDYVKKRHGSAGSASARWRPAALVVALAAAGMLTKEQAVTSLAVCATFEVFVWHRASVKDVLTLRLIRDAHYRSALEGLGLLAAGGSALLAFRIVFMGSKPPEFAPSDNPASDSDSLLTRTLTYFHLPALNVWMILCPSVLSFDWSMEAVPLLQSIWDHRNIITVVFYSALAYIFFIVSRRLEHESGALDKERLSAVRMNNNNTSSTSAYHKQNGQQHSNGYNSKAKKYSSSVFQQHASDSEDAYGANATDAYRHIDVIILALSIIVFPFIPASNMFFYVGFVIAERILYIPSMGFCLLVGLGVEMLYQKFNDASKRKVLVACLCVLLFCFSAKTFLRNRDWQTEERLYASGIKVNPAKAWGNLANIFNDRNDTVNAEESYRNALSYRPNMADVHYNLGILLQNQQRSQEAIESYNKAIRFRPKLSVAYLNLGILLAKLGDVETAKSTYAKCADLDTSILKDPRLHDKTKISCLFNHGRLLMDEHKYDQALALFQLALKRKPDYYESQSLYNMLGLLYFETENYEEAEKWYKAALAAKPDHIPAHLTMATLFQTKGKPDEALKWLNKAKQLDPNDVSVDIHKAHLLTSSGKPAEAIKIYEQLSPQSSSEFDVVYNAATAFREHGDHLKAEELYVRAVRLRPQDPTALMNLGAMYHMNRKYDKAEQAYMEALRLKPDSQVTKDNLQRLRSLKASRGTDP